LRCISVNIALEQFNHSVRDASASWIEESSEASFVVNNTKISSDISVEDFHNGVSGGLVTEVESDQDSGVCRVRNQSPWSFFLGVAFLFIRDTEIE